MTPACHVCKWKITLVMLGSLYDDYALVCSYCFEFFPLFILFLREPRLMRFLRRQKIIPRNSASWIPKQEVTRYIAWAIQLQKMSRWLSMHMYFIHSCFFVQYMSIFFQFLKWHFLYRFNFIKASVDLLKGSPLADINKMN